MECAEAECDAEAVVELHVPWDENRVLCPSHARSVARQDGVVAAPLDGQEDEWP